MYSIRLSALLKNIKLIFTLGLTLFFIQRLSIFVWSLNTANGVHFLQTLSAFALGFIFDISVMVYITTPFILFYLCFPRFKNESVAKKLFSTGLKCLNFFFVLFMFYTTTAEMFFWDEFRARYNFIAVDYLVYTNEVLKNIWESYPVLKISIALVVFTLILLVLINRRIQLLTTTDKPYLTKIKMAAALVLILVVNYFGISQNYAFIPKDIGYQEVAKNGVYSLFYSYFENQINYDQFYMNLDSKHALQNVKDSLQAGSTYTGKENEETLKREVIYANPVPELKMNVVLVLMESMGGHFMKAYGSDENITPNLDLLATQGLFYNNVYATGTRTVRGIEAVTLSVPPTPGQSIVRRQKNEQLVTINSYFAKAGYDVNFVYGGHAYFDNMKYYFENNDTKVIDIDDLPENEVKFANAWGLSDEDVFQLSLKAADHSFKNKKPFFQLVLTTSNHRPYTFPEGAIDIPSGSGRSGAVKYADYAIGKFIEQVKTKPWFNNTIFIFVADHDASVAGNTEVNMRDYRIPLIFYSPSLIKPETVSKLASQIDVGPTLLGLLNMSHESFAFGYDLRKSSPERAFISNFQKVGLLKPNFLTLLEPRKKYKQYKVNDSKYEDAALEQTELDSTIAYYQTASRLYTNEKLKSCNEQLVIKRR